MAFNLSQSQLTPKAQFSTNNRAQGFTIVEILIALAVFVIILPGLFSVLWRADATAINDQNYRQALDLAQTTLNVIKRQSFYDIKSSSSQSSSFQTTVTVALLDLYTKQVDLKVSWQTLPLPKQEVHLTTLVTDPSSALAGSTCLLSSISPGPMVVKGNIALPGSSNLTTGLVVRNHTAYVTTDSTTASDTDFFTIDLTDDVHPLVLGRLNTGPGLSSLAVVDHYAYLGNTSINAQLQIVDVANRQSPVLKSQYKLPGTYTDNTTIANAIAYDKQKIYLGTQKSQIAELHIIDVSNVSTPQEIGSFEVDAGINSLYARNNIVYIASPAAEEVKIVDASNPGNIHQVGGFDAPGGSGNGKSLASLDTTLILGRTIGGQELYELNMANPAQLNLTSGTDVNTSINALAVTPSLLFMATIDTIKTVRLWDNTDPAHPVLLKMVPLADRATAIACGLSQLYVTAGNKLYVVSP